MTCEVSKNAFLSEKLNNFIKFLSDAIKQKNELVKTLNSLKSYPIQYFVQYVKVSIVPYKDDLDGFITKLCIEYNINIYDFGEEEKDKLKRYLTMFIEVVEDN
jgi:hypothetical protein